MKNIVQLLDGLFQKCKQMDFLALLAIRLYLLPTLYDGARSKVLGFANTVAWFADPVSKGGLGLPFPYLMAFLSTGTEVMGCILLTLGLCTRLISIPLAVLMSVAGLSVHWTRGWPAIATTAMESSQRLDGFMQWLSQNFPGRFNYITEFGDPVILNNGMEFTTTYLLMILILFCFGGGRYVSVDYWLTRKWNLPFIK